MQAWNANQRVIGRAIVVNLVLTLTLDFAMFECDSYYRKETNVNPSKRIGFLRDK